MDLYAMAKQFKHKTIRDEAGCVVGAVADTWVDGSRVMGKVKLFMGEQAE